jgi:ankyrin repeat protein
MLNTSHLIKMPPAGFKKALNEVRNIASQPATREESTLEGKVYPCAFDRNIRRLSRRQGAGDILTFVRDGGRPFSTIELQYVLALHNKPETFDEATLCHGSGFSDITQGIVTVGNGGLVGFVHPGLKTYLQHDRKIDGCILDLSDKNSVLAQICVSYLSSPRFTGGPCTSREELENRISESPFLDYAVKYWHMHYTEASKNEADVALRKSVVRFLSQEGSVSSARQCMAHSQSLSKLHELNSPQDLSRNGSPESLQWTYPDQTRLQTTGLHLAIHLRLDELAIILTTDLKPSVVNRADGNGATPLHLAVAFGANDVVRMIVLHGGNLNMRNTKGFSPWHIAAAKGDLPAVTTFLDQATERLDVNLTVLPKGFQQQTQPVIAPNNASTRSWMYNGRDIRTATALHLAARNGHVEVVQQIISDKRCNKLAEDCFGMSEFHKACKYGRLEVVKLLINIHQKYIHHSSCKDGRTGFHVACKYDAGYEVAKYLLEAYPDLCRMKDKSGNVALHHAAVGGNVKTVQMLLQQSDINVNESNHAGQTPLELAARHPSPAICTLYDHEGVRRWVEIEGTPIEDIVQRYRHKPTEV